MLNWWQIWPCELQSAPHTQLTYELIPKIIRWIFPLGSLISLYPIMSNKTEAFHSRLNWAGFCPVICEQYVFSSLSYVISSFFLQVLFVSDWRTKALFPNSYLLYTLREHSDITLTRLSDPHNNRTNLILKWLLGFSSVMVGVN